MKLLDLFCGAGGAAMGYYRAGFTEIVGIDIKPQPRYPFVFVQGDALFPPLDLSTFDMIHASPPCQVYSGATPRRTRHRHQDLIPQTRHILNGSGKPYVIENVPRAPLNALFTLCGCQVGLALRRKRLFETNVQTFALLPPCQHDGPVVSVVGHGTPTWVREQLGFNPTIKDYRAAMGINWMNRDELSQAIPPAYTEWIGRRIIEAEVR